MSFPIRAAGSGRRCPYPGCKNDLENNARVCGCEYKLPTRQCAKCGMWNRGAARYCRACRSELAEERMEIRSSPPPADFIEVAGDFYYPAVWKQGLLWCLGADGKISRVSPRNGARPFAFAELPSRMTGMNRILAVDATESAPPFRGPLLIACDTSSIYGISLLTGESRVLHSQSGKGNIVANTVPEESIYFRGMAATSDMVCFLRRATDAHEATLAIRYFNPRRAAEDPVTISGSEFLTPVISGDQVCVASDEETWIYDLRDQSRQRFLLPRNFRPFFKRGWEFNVPPGSVPLATGKTEEGRQVWIGGGQDDRRAGILKIAMDRESAEFVELEKGAAISDAWPAGWAVNRVDRAEFYGLDRPVGRIGALQPAMPLGYASPRLAYFSRSGQPGSHRLTLLLPEAVELRFEDNLCNENTCCDILICGPEIVVSYLSRGGPAIRGIKFAHWNLAG